MTFMTLLFIGAALVAGFALITGIRIVPQAKVMVVERLGRFHHVAHSGLNILIPFLDSPRAFEMRTGNRLMRSNMVDLREQVMGFETVQVITHDNVNMEVGSVIYYQVVDPAKALYAVENLALAIEQLTMTNLRNVMGGLTLDQTLTSRETVNSKLRMVLDEATEKWGVKVTRVELREIEPPHAIKEAMAKQMTAERERRAEVTKAEGDKAAAILQAEGEKISRILRAEAERDAEVARAEGHKRAVVLDAEAKAEATRLVFEAVHAGRGDAGGAGAALPGDAAGAGQGRQQGVRAVRGDRGAWQPGHAEGAVQQGGRRGVPRSTDRAVRGGAERAGARRATCSQPQQAVPVRRGAPALPQDE